MKKQQLLLLSFLSGILLSVGWFPHGQVYILFFAFIPLLMVEDHFYNDRTLKPRLLFLCSYLTFLTWNLGVTWWISNASLGGSIPAFILNSLFMAIVFQMFHRTKKRVGEKWSGVLFISFWLAFEFLHINWELSWPWLTLGNAFSDSTIMIQWYEYTGVFGGSLWILLMNVLIYTLFTHSNFDLYKFSKKGIAIVVGVLVMPMILSSFILLSGKYRSMDHPIKVVAVQPNIDPYNEKFNGDYESQVKKMITLADEKVDSSTDYLLYPETALTEDIWEDQILQSNSIHQFQNFIKKFPKLKIIIGASTGKVFKPGETLSETARKFTQDEGYYDSYNTALQIDNTNIIQIYHKSKLVIGAEKMPFAWLMKPLEKLALDLGGTMGTLGSQEERTAFTSNDLVVKTAPVICYESIYGEYCTDYIKNGASFISIITNDGWWGDSPGHIQHLKFGALRAIETRKWIARSANTGISGFISPYGEILQPTGYWVPAVISQEIQPNTTLTFYVKHGDYIARAAVCITLAMLIYALLIRLRIIKKS